MVNPAALLTFKKKWEEFSGRHPKFVSFLGVLKGRGVDTGSIIDIKVTLPNGEMFQSNLKLTEEDVETIKSLAGRGK